jgi:hypothetical protein
MSWYFVGTTDRGWQVADVRLRRNVGAGRPCVLRGAEGRGVHVGGSRLHHQTQGEPAYREQVDCGVDQRPDRCDALRTDDVCTGDQRAEPVGEVDDLLAGDPREEVFVSTGEPHHLVWKDRADDESDVVFDDRPVDHHVDRLAQPTVGEPGHHIGVDGPHRGEGLG